VSLITRSGGRTLLFIGMLLFSSAAIFGQNVRPAWLDQRAEVLLPVGYNRNRKYPVFVVLPPTGARATQVVRRYGLDPQRQKTFILLLPKGAPTRADYLPDFLSFVDWYEQRLLADIDHVLENYSADPNRVYLGGYSLGGDLSWALSVRNPDRFAGAVIGGSRTSHPVEDEDLLVMKQRGFRAGFLMGSRDDPLRYRGINVARQRLEAAGVEHTYKEYPAAHVIPPISLFQDTILYVTDVASLPQPGPAGPAAKSDYSPLVSHTSRDRFALGARLPADIGPGGFSVPNDTTVTGRIEWPFQRLYLRTTAEWGSTETTSDTRNSSLRQDMLVAYGDGRHFWGAGIGGDWIRTITGGSAYRTFDLLLMHGRRNPWIVPAGTADPDRVDSLLVLRYTLPAGIGGGIAPEQLFNLRAEYLLRIGDLFVVDLSAGSYTVQNHPVAAAADLSDALDHRLEWHARVGLRAPSPFLWRVGYQGTREQPLPDGDPSLRGTWTVSLEYSY